MNAILSLLKKLYDNVETFEKIIETLKKIWNKIVYAIILICLFILFIQFKKTREFIIKITKQEDIVSFVYKYSNIFLFVILLITICKYLYDIWKLNKIEKNTTKNDISYNIKDFTNKLHKLFIHDLRDNIRELDNILYDLRLNNQDISKFVRKTMFQNLRLLAISCG